MSFIIRLQNLSRFAKSSDIRAFFSSLSIPGGSVCIVGGDSGEAYIGFATDEDARQAMLRDGLVLCQNRVKLTFSSRKEMQEAMEQAQQMNSVVKNVEKVTRPAAMSNNSSMQAGRPMPNSLPGPNADFNQAKNNPTETYNAGTSWLSSPNKSQQEASSAPAVDNSWKDFLEQALQRIEKAKDSGQSGPSVPSQAEPKTGTSLLGPPRHSNNQDNRQKLGQQLAPPKSDYFPNFRPPAKPVQQTHEYRQIDPNNGNKFPPNNYRQAHQPRSPGPDTQKAHLPPRLSPPSNNKFSAFNQQNAHKMEPAHQAPSHIQNSVDNEYEATLRQQQMAAVEQMSMPAISHVYDPEELFVEFSRLPQNLIDINDFKQFLLPTVPVEIRMAYSGDVHMCSVCFFADQGDANSFIHRDGEAGIKVRWSGRHAFFALPPLPQNLNQLNPQVWDIPSNEVQQGKRSLDPPFQGDIKRAKSDHYKQETSWTKPLNSIPKQQVSQNVFYVLLMNVNFKATNWDISKALEELNMRALNITHVFSPDSERSDKWIIECATIDEANRLVENPPYLFGRQSQADMVNFEAAQDIYQNGYQARWQKQSFQQNADSGKRPGHPNAPNSNVKPLFPPKSIANTPSKPTKPTGQPGGFFSGSAYGKIRSATLPNPSSPSASKPKTFENEQYDEDQNGNYGNDSGFGRGRGRGFRGAPRGSKSFGSFRPSGPPNRGNFSNFRGKRGGFRGGRGGFHRGDDELAA